jgi:hypothetical protein
MNTNSSRFQVRRKYSLLLKPIKILLLSKRQAWSRDYWFRYVQETKERILLNPEEYLGTDLPEPEVLRDTVEFIFRDFLLRNYRNSKIIDIRMSMYEAGKKEQEQSD